MPDLRLTLAIGDYLHTQDLALGRVKPIGIELTVLVMRFEELATRFQQNREWEVSEYSLAGYCATLARGEPSPMVALPVFPSRLFRHGAIFVRADAGIAHPGDLAGRRVGIPQWAQTAGVVVRGWLAREAGLPLDAVRWVQAGLHEAGRADRTPIALPSGVVLDRRPAATLDGLLAAGEIDAVISARPPRAFVAGDKRIRRLLPDHRAAERAWFAQSGSFPIMHLIVVRRDVCDVHPWVLRQLADAFDVAKRNCFARLADATTSYLPAPWAAKSIAAANAGVFPAGDPWPYGIEPNRLTLERFLEIAPRKASRPGR